MLHITFLVMGKYKGTVQQLSKRTCICRPYTTLYCTIIAACSAALYTVQCTKQCSNGRTQGLSLLLPGFEFAAAGEIETWDLSLLLLWFAFAAAGGD